MAEQLHLKPIHPIATILTHLRLIAMISIGGTALMVLLILWKVKPTYTADSGIEVAPTHTRVLHWDATKSFNSRIQFTDYVNTQTSYIVSFENVSEALSTVDLERTSLEQGDTPGETAENFQNMMKVAWVPDTNLISVAVSSSDPTGLDLLANALVDTYMKRNRELELGKSNARIAHLKEEETTKRASLDEMNVRMTRYTRILGTMALGEVSPQEQSLIYLREAYDAAFVLRLEAESEYEALLESVRAETELGVGPLVDEWVQEDLKSMRNNAFEDIAELNRSASNLTDDHPRLKQLQSDVEQGRENLKRAVIDNRERASKVLAGKMDLEQKRSLIQARANYEGRLRSETELKVKYDADEAHMKEVIPVYLNAVQLDREIARDHVRLTQIEARLEELAIEAREPSRVRVQSQAREPRHPSKNRRRIFAALALLVCASMALVLAFALDFFEPSIISPQHMAQVIGSRPTGVLAHHPMKDFGSLLRLEPESYASDQFRRIMPRIFTKPYDRENPGIFVVLALSPGAGVTSIALNCLTHLKNVDHTAGLLEVTVGKNQLAERTRDWGFESEKISLPENLRQRYPLTLRTNGGLECYSFDQPRSKDVLSDHVHMGELLHHLAGRTGCLLVEGPPLLQHSEAELLCRFADVVLLVVDGPDTAPGELKRGVALLEELGVKNCAVFANKLPLMPGGYFSKAKASFEGRELRYPLLGEIVTAVKKAINPLKK